MDKRYRWKICVSCQSALPNTNIKVLRAGSQTHQEVFIVLAARLVNYWEVVIFSWITGNADMHLKNFSLYNNRKLGYGLTPAYDLLCTKIVMPEDTEELALTLNGRKRKIQKSDFVKVMTASGLSDKVINNIAKKFRRSIVKWLDLIEASFLPDSMKKEYKKLILSRVMALR